MPIIENRMVLAVSRKVSVFFDLAFGVTRPEHPRVAGKPRNTAPDEEIQKIRRQLANKSRRVEQLEAKLAEKTTPPETEGVSPENLIWIFGNGRTGSTWLSRMMGEIKGHAVWFEPSVGELFGNLYYEARSAQRRSKIFILGDQQRETWSRSIRSFVLEGADARFPLVGKRKGLLVVKEPHGSVGAPLLMEALPESRQILLVRDPRDVVSSALDAFKKGSWGYERTREDNMERVVLANERPDDFVRGRAESYLRGMEKAKEAYEAHGGRKSLVRYEELRSDTLNTIKRIYGELEIEVDEKALADAVEKHSWENIPGNEKGAGKFYRKASPGEWNKDLTPEQVALVEEITAPLLKAFY